MAGSRSPGDDAGDAARWWRAYVLAENDRENELRELAAAGDDSARRHLASWLSLGFQLLRDDDSVPGIRWIQVGPPGGGTALTLVTWFDTMPPGSLRGLVLSSSDLAADYQRLRGLGVDFDQPPAQQPWATEAVLHDPDGNEFVLQQV